MGSLWDVGYGDLPCGGSGVVWDAGHPEVSLGCGDVMGVPWGGIWDGGRGGDILGPGRGHVGDTGLSPHR